MGIQVQSLARYSQIQLHPDAIATGCSCNRIQLQHGGCFLHPDTVQPDTTRAFLGVCQIQLHPDTILTYSCNTAPGYNLQEPEQREVVVISYSLNALSTLTSTVVNMKARVSRCYLHRQKSPRRQLHTSPLKIE